MTVVSDFSGIVEKAKQVEKPVRVALAKADSENILKGLFWAQRDGFVEPILLGDEEKILAMLERLGLKDEHYQLHHVSSDQNVVQVAIEMVNAGRADALMRGDTQTRDFLMPILNKGNHLIDKGNWLSHVAVLKVPGLEKLLSITDVTIAIEPSIEQRKLIIRNLVSLLKEMGIERPNIALLSLVETPSFRMWDSIDAQTIVKQQNREPFADCNLVGPIAYDLIMSKESARLKNYDCPYCGEFDGMVVPNLMAGNLVVKILEKSAGAKVAGVIVGANIPIAITSRSDSPEHAYLSLAAMIATFRKQ